MDKGIVAKKREMLASSGKSGKASWRQNGFSCFYHILLKCRSQGILRRRGWGDMTPLDNCGLVISVPLEGSVWGIPSPAFPGAGGSSLLWQLNLDGW